MKNTMKKITLLFAVMIMAMLFSVLVSAKVVELTGQCGDKVYWNYDETTGELVISGEGDITSYNPYESPFSYSDIKNIVIEEGVTRIGDLAFWVCTNLTSVTIPESVTSIGVEAFFHCDSLKNITISDKITSIGDGAFYECKNLVNIEVDENNDYYSSVDGALFDKDITKLIQYPIGNKRTAFVIPNGVTSIEFSAFRYCPNLISITIPDTISSIGVHAFEHCAKLTNVILPKSLKNIEKYVFRSCSELTNITIPDGVTNICEGAFVGCNNLISVKIGKSVRSIGYSAFSYCSNLSSIIIPNSVAAIEDSTFMDCTNLSDVYYSGTEAQWAEIVIGNNNESLLNATIHYNYSDETPETPTEPNTPTEDCSCNCHKSGIGGIIWKILRFFYKFLGLNKTCACGVAHY